MTVADHMTAEQLRAELAALNEFLGVVSGYAKIDDERVRLARGKLTSLAARLSGMAAVPKGWKLVPIEHTAEMADAFQGQGVHAFALTTFRLGDFHVRYRALLDAAPEPPHV